jgi:glycolate oxidase
MYTLVAPFTSLHRAIETVPKIIQRKILPMAVEFLQRDTIETTEALLDKQWPCREGEAHLMIIVDGTTEEEIMALAETVGVVCLENEAIDVFVADEK